MKIDFCVLSELGDAVTIRQPEAHVTSETGRLTDVILCPPRYLTPVPCCSVTRQSIRSGFETCRETAAMQHDQLTALLERHGVRCHMLTPAPDLPDMCFTRDIAVATPFGLIALHPATDHRRREVERLMLACHDWGIAVSRIGEGTIEGGDICIARDGLLLVGISGERTSREGLDAFAAPFRATGWDVLACPFNPDYLHLDTIFCMVSPDQAIGCVDLLDVAFVDELKQRGISILPAPISSAGGLGCNVLHLDDRTIVTSTSDRAVIALLQGAGYQVEAVDVSQFAACGGGIHCLVQPLRRLS